YEDLAPIFKSVVNHTYTKEEYNEQFMVRIPEHLSKIDRIMRIYQKQVPDAPKVLYEILEEQRQRLLKAREKYGDYITPDQLVKGKK
ncbi:MAG: phosphoenolpyruvate carboxykinase, partial [Dehalococcoidia bacterium]